MTESENALENQVASVITPSCKISDSQKKLNIISYLSVKLIKAYRYWISPLLPASCRFYPSCSQYALESFQKLSFCRASYLTVMRLLKCNPLHPGGFDDVPSTGLSDTEFVNLSKNN